MTVDGILCHITVQGSIDGETLSYFADRDLIPSIMRSSRPLSVLLLDNCSIHKNETFLKLMDSIGAQVVFLPPYSPWLNPIEQVFRSVKHWLRRYSNELLNSGCSVPDMLIIAFESISSNVCQALVTEAGYV